MRVPFTPGSPLTLRLRQGRSPLRTLTNSLPNCALQLRSQISVWNTVCLRPATAISLKKLSNNSTCCLFVMNNKAEFLSSSCVALGSLPEPWHIQLKQKPVTRILCLFDSNSVNYCPNTWTHTLTHAPAHTKEDATIVSINTVQNKSLSKPHILTFTSAHIFIHHMFVQLVFVRTLDAIWQKINRTLASTSLLHIFV